MAIDPNNTIDSSFEFTPQNPFTIDIPKDPSNDNNNEDVAYPGFPVEEEKQPLLQTAGAELRSSSTLYKLFNWANEPLNKPAPFEVSAIFPEVNDKFYHPAPDGWTPKQELEKQSNIDPKQVPYLLGATNPEDFNYRLAHVNQNQEDDQTLQNGSRLGKVLGGSIGYTLGSVENLIPVTTGASLLKVSSSFVSGALKSVAGVTTAAAIREGANQLDSTQPKLANFLKDTFIDSAFGLCFFGSIGAAKTFVNLAEMNSLKSFARNFLDGIGFDHVVNDKGELTGFKAVDLGTNEAMNAAKVNRAQEQADAAFNKSGLFKIPYLGATALSLVSGNIPGFKYLFGSPLVQLKTSKYKAANLFADIGFDHFITTEGEAKGGVRQPSFELNVKKTRAAITKLSVLTNALHMERNGYSIENRPAIGLINAWSSMKQKTIEALSKDTKSTDFVSKPDFMDEIQRVLYTDTQSEHSSVNEAASIYRNVIDTTWKAYRVAHNLPDDWMPPKTAAAYLMRVYDTDYLNANEGKWVHTISNWLKESDEKITQRMQPINDLDAQIKDFEAKHTAAVEELGKREAVLNPETLLQQKEEYIPKENLQLKPRLNEEGLTQLNEKVKTLSSMRLELKSMKENLQNELRSDPEWNIHVEKNHALSANEAHELVRIKAPLDKLNKKVEEQNKIIADLKRQASQQLSAAKKTATKDKAKPKAEKFVDIKAKIKEAEEKLGDFKNAASDEENRLYVAMKNGDINPRLYYPDELKFKDPNDRLRLRDVYKDHEAREIHAKSYYDSIMNMKPQDIVSDVFGKIIGKKDENVLQARTLNVPDELLYNNNFMTKDLFAKTANYVNYLSKRTHLKNAFKNVTVTGDFEELAEGLGNEYQENRAIINDRIEALKHTLANAEDETSKKNIQKQITEQQKLLNNEKKEFNNIKSVMAYLYKHRMMGLDQRSDFDTMARRGFMALTAAANLHNLPATQITDLGFAGFQHGIWPFVRDGLYPLINSMAGILKTKDAEALREMAPHINLGLQDSLNNYADRQWSSELQPTINMGKIVSGIEKYAHFSALTDLTPYIDNGVQRLNGSIIQSRFMELLHKQLDGSLSQKESLYLRKYGIDPKEWAERMVNAYKESGGFKTTLGGYMSKAWQWQDMEAANVFNTAVFRGIQNTLLWKGMADSPFFADNIIGMFFHTFTGWGYAAANRYLIPSMQHPDGELLLKLVWMMGIGSLVSPTRRVSRGEQPWPDDMTPEQHAYEAWSDSGVMSNISNVLNIANLMSDDKLIGDLKNDKFRNRMKTGIFGLSDVISSTVNNVAAVLGMVHSGLDEKDMKTASRMLPITGAMYGHYISNKIIESYNLPRNKRAAEIE
jgi:hypothetical protein